MAIDINITVNNGDGEGQKKKKDDDKTKIIKLSAGTKAAINVSKQAINYLTSRVGQWTGDYAAQDTINVVNNIGGRIASLGTAISTGNPYIIGAVMASQAISDITALVDQLFQIKWENRSAAESQRRSGNYLTDRSR